MAPVGQRLGMGQLAGAGRAEGPVVVQRSPGGQLHSQVPVDCDGQEGEDGRVSENHHQAAHKQAGVEVDADAQTHHDGQGHDEDPHRDISQRQGNDEVQSRVLKRRVQLHHPDDQDVTHSGKQSNQALGTDVNPIQAAQRQAVVWHDELLEMLPRWLELQKGAWASMTVCGIRPQCLVLSCSSDFPACKPLPVFHILGTGAANQLLPFHRAANTVASRNRSPLWTDFLKLTASLQQPGISKVLWKVIWKEKNRKASTSLLTSNL